MLEIPSCSLERTLQRTSSPGRGTRVDVQAGSPPRMATKARTSGATRSRARSNAGGVRSTPPGRRSRLGRPDEVAARQIDLDGADASRPPAFEELSLRAASGAIAEASGGRIVDMV